MITKQELLTVLREGPIEVTFIKKNKEERKMRCTLSQHSIPEEKLPKAKSKEEIDATPINEKAIAVFDLDKGEWRSFRVGSIKEESSKEIKKISKQQLQLPFVG